MHPKVFREFERICLKRSAGGAVLEVGAVPNDESLLCLKSLEKAHRKIGVNIDGPFEHKDFEILKVNANDMSCFETGMFDTVVTNSTLEHDRFFWKTLAEIQRVTRKGGLIVIGVPGFVEFNILRKMKEIPLLANLLSRPLSSLFASTPVLQVHNYPGDFYRFSPQSVREVFFHGMKEVEIVTVMFPPRIIGSGIKE